MGLQISESFIEIIVGAFCCDTPARSFIKNIKGHNAYSGCDFCSTPGELIQGRMTFCYLKGPLRTNDQFRERTDEDHHKGYSPLEELPIDLINDFPTDYMHSVCLGVVRKMLFLWRDQGRGFGIRNQNISTININIQNLSKFWPVDFNRKPQSLQNLENWKATEFRHFLLYVGPVVLKREIPDYMFGNFMILSFAMNMILNKELNAVYNEYADYLLKLFVKHSIRIYGKTFCIYNVHSLIHLAPIAKKFDSLDLVNCFAFENFLGILKRMLRKPNLPLEQVVRRMKELRSYSCSNQVTKNHLSGPISIVVARQLLNITSL